MSKRTRNEALAQQEQSLQDTSRTNAKWIKQVKEKSKKKKLNHTYEDFIGCDMDFPFIRPIEKWKRKSHNKDRQVEEFIKYAFFKYEVPNWAMEMMKNLIKFYHELPPQFDFSKDRSRNTVKNSMSLDSRVAFCVTTTDILKCAMTGKGYKETLGHIFTKKEIHNFVNSNEDEIKNAYMTAKLSSYTTDKHLIDFFMNRDEFGAVIRGTDNVWSGATYITPLMDESGEDFIDRKKRSHQKFLDGNKYYKLMTYLLKHNLSVNDCQEIFDFFRTVSLYSESHTRARGRDLPRGSFLYINEEIVMVDDFFKRSIGNVITMSNEWHLLRVYSHNKNTKAPSDWDKRFEEYEMGRYKVQELNTSNLLSAEGKAMGHCVGSYAYRCGRGDCNILSLKRDDGRLLTMEVVKDKIVQVKGKHNRSPNENEIDVVRNIANFYNLSVSGVI